MLRSVSSDTFLRDPIGQCVRGRTYLVWCLKPGLCGTIYWGRSSVDDARKLVQLFEIHAHAAMERPFDVLTDCRQVRSVDPAAFLVLRRCLRSRRDVYRERVRRNAVVYPAGLLGSAILGLYPMIRPHHVWRPFLRARSALRWLGHLDVENASTGDLGALVAPSVSVLEQVRLVLSKARPGVQIGDVAIALGTSTRSLQRSLRQAGVTFRDELTRIPVERAHDLLEGDDRKRDAIATEAGFASRFSLYSALRQRRRVVNPSRS